MSYLWTTYTCHNYYATLCTFGILNGLGSGLAYGVSMAVGMRYFPNYKGLINGLILAGYGFGSFVFNPILTKIVNPDNYKLPEGVFWYYIKENYYPPEIVKRVPTAFAILGLSFAAIQLVAALLLRNPIEKKEIPLEPLEVVEKKEFTKEEITHGLSAKQTIKTKQFYMLWCVCFCNAFAVTLIASFWKEMGIERVSHNDSFLALAGSISSIFNAVSRPIWGSLADRVGYKYVMSTVVGFIAIMSFTFYFVRTEWLYMVYVCGIYMCIGGNYAVTPTEVAMGFGQKNFGLLYGLVLTSQSIYFLF